MINEALTYPTPCDLEQSSIDAEMLARKWRAEGFAGIIWNDFSYQCTSRMKEKRRVQDDNNNISKYPESGTPEAPTLAMRVSLIALARSIECNLESLVAKHTSIVHKNNQWRRNQSI